MIKFLINFNQFFCIKENPYSVPACGKKPLTLFYIHNFTSFPVAYETTMELVRIIKEKIITIHNNPLIAPTHFSSNLGYDWNHAYHHYCNNDNTALDKTFFKYMFFSTYETITWFYTKNSSFIIEITPCYKWSDCTPTKNEQFETFEEFMKNYKPIAIHEISKKTAQEWLKQAQDYLDIIEPQFEQWCKEHKDELYHLKEDA